MSAALNHRFKQKKSRRNPCVGQWFLIAASTLALSACSSGTGRYLANELSSVNLIGTAGQSGNDPHVPAFASQNFEPFNRQDTVAIAMREWRLFGQPVADDDPEDRPEVTDTTLKPERAPGLWQRVGEYWWIGQDPTAKEVNWTGKHNASGDVFSAKIDGNFAWSAAFISYVMRIAGANGRFPYSANHATYINAAAAGTSSGLIARDPTRYIPRLGDLLCVGRGRSRSLTFSMLPTQQMFPAHCGLVVAVGQKAPPFGYEISIIGGNVDDSVSLTHVPTDAKGALADSQGHIYDSRYPWLAVLQVQYDADMERSAGQ